MCLRLFGLYCSACLGILFVSILYMCCSHFSWYCFISFTIFSAPVFSLIHWFFSLSSFVIPRRCLKNFICAASKRCSSLFFSTQASLPNFNAALAVMVLLFYFSKINWHREYFEVTTIFGTLSFYDQYLLSIYFKIVCHIYYIMKRPDERHTDIAAARLWFRFR